MTNLSCDINRSSAKKAACGRLSLACGQHMITSMMDASRLADSRRAEYGEEDMANSVRAVGTSSLDEVLAASAALALASAGTAML